MVWYTEEFFVFLQSPQRVKILRKQFNEVKEELVRQQSNTEFHHIIPLSLGGTNEKTNIVECKHGTHRQIHEYINLQLDKLPKRIKIPKNTDSFWGSQMRL